MNLLVRLDNGNHYARMRGGFKLKHCTYQLNSLGLLHYHDGGPLLMFKKALADCIGFGHIPPYVTVDNYQSFADIINAKRNETHKMFGGHKFERVLHVLDHGVPQYSYQYFSQTRETNLELIYVGNISEILRKIRL